MQIIDWLRRVPKPGPIWEVSGGPLSDCITRPLWDEGYECVITEPNPEHYADYGNATLNRDNVTFLPVAIALEPGTLRLAREKSGAAYVAGARSPQVQRCGDAQWPERTRTVAALPFDVLDPGNIAAMLLDVEGCEWWVLQRMKSRPRVLIVELSHDRYSHPNEDEIREWAAQNGYQITEVKEGGAQTVFALRDGANG